MNRLSIKENCTFDVMFDLLNYFFLAVGCLIVIYPLYFIVIASVSNPNYVAMGQVVLFPKGFTLSGYKEILDHAQIWIGYKNTIVYTVFGTFINIALTTTCAYALACREFVFRKVISGFILFTMFFSGGLVPTYLIVKELHMIDTIWVMLLLNAVSVWNVVIARTFFENSLSPELKDASFIDGCSHTLYFFKIVLPLSKALLAVLTLYYAVSHWNQYFNALIYLNNKSKHPLQLVLRQILLENTLNQADEIDLESYAERQQMADLIKYGSIIVSSLPVLIAYPFMQKYFVKGVMIGAVKG